MRLLFLFFILLSLLNTSQTSEFVDLDTPMDFSLDGYTLVFSDEFNNHKVDQKKWNLGINPQNIQNTTVVCLYDWKNIRCKNGELIFTQRKENPSVNGSIWGKKSFPFSYSSGGLNTTEKFKFTNNMYVELRVKLPSNSGGYAAFWGMANDLSLPVEDQIELDFYEFIANPDKQKLWSGLWWHEYKMSEMRKDILPKDIMKRPNNNFFMRNQTRRAHYQPNLERKLSRINFDDYIIFGFRVDDKLMEWFISEDECPLKNKPFMTFTGGNVYSTAYDKGEYQEDSWQRGIPNPLRSNLIINYAMRDTTWAGGPIDDEALPSSMKIDYIRVYTFKEK